VAGLDSIDLLPIRRQPEPPIGRCEHVLPPHRDRRLRYRYGTGGVAALVGAPTYVALHALLQTIITRLMKLLTRRGMLPALASAAF
jgi:hypothetical protein